jgi:hypothetical protein
MAALRLSSRFLFGRVLLVSIFQRRGPLDAAAADGNHTHKLPSKADAQATVGEHAGQHLLARAKVVYVMTESAVQRLL